MAEKKNEKVTVDRFNPDKSAALEVALKGIEKQFGKGSVMKLGEATARIGGIKTISSGSLELDIALGIGGIPRGRIIEIFGPESSGKTTLSLHVIAEAQKSGGTAAFIDVEHALDPSYASKLGVDIDNLLVSQPDTGEQALEIAEALVRSGAIDVVVIDSVAALVPKAEIEGEMGDSHVGLQARLMSQALRKLAGAISKSNTIVIFINQLREKIASTGIMVPGNDTPIHLTISGGLAMCPTDGQSTPELLRAADGALYESKRKGGNRILAAQSLALDGSIIGTGRTEEEKTGSENREKGT